MVELLVERGADLLATDPKDGLTPLGWAKRAKQDEVMERLKYLGAQ
jgi:ankyrin repeat protein